MILAKDLKNIDIKLWRKLGGAFYCLAHHDYDAWNALPKKLKQTDVGLICEEYLNTQIPI